MGGLEVAAVRDIEGQRDGQPGNRGSRGEGLTGVAEKNQSRAGAVLEPGWNRAGAVLEPAELAELGWS